MIMIHRTLLLGVSSDVAELKDMNPHAINQNKFDRGNTSIKNRGNNFNQGQIIDPSGTSPVCEKHAKPRSNLQSQWQMLTGHASKFVTANTASYLPVLGLLLVTLLPTPKEDQKFPLPEVVYHPRTKEVNHDIEVTNVHVASGLILNARRRSTLCCSNTDRNQFLFKPKLAPVVTPVLSHHPFPHEEMMKRRKEKR
ncbi:hypothetical protein Tco_0722277 [Tanacetum coccineum]